MKVASYNIHKCRGLDGVTRPDRIIGVIRELDADLIALQEVDRRFGRRGGLLDPAAISARPDMQLLVQSDVSHRHGWHGNALLVRGDPISYRRSRLKLPGREPRGAIVAEIDLGDGEFRVIAAHLGLFRLSRVDQVDALMSALSGTCRQCRPSCSAISTNGEDGGGLRCAGSNRLSESRRQSSAFHRGGPFSRSTGFSGWPEGLITDLAVHDTPLARRSSDHLPLTAEANLEARMPAARRAA